MEPLREDSEPIERLVQSTSENPAFTHKERKNQSEYSTHVSTVPIDTNMDSPSFEKTRENEAETLQGKQENLSEGKEEKAVVQVAGNQENLAQILDNGLSNEGFEADSETSPGINLVTSEVTHGDVEEQLTDVVVIAGNSKPRADENALSDPHLSRDDAALIQEAALLGKSFM